MERHEKKDKKEKTRMEKQNKKTIHMTRKER